MKISILTLFPEMFVGPFDHSIIKRAQEKNLAEIELVNIRDFGIGKHKIVDDTPYGGGTGMVLRVDVVASAISNVKCSNSNGKWKMKNGKCNERVVLMDARGETFTQQKSKTYSQLDHLILICGHYEGIDERIYSYIDEAVSIGDYVLTGGELPAMVLTDSIVRLIPGVIKQNATEFESFTKLDTTKNTPLLEYPQYTKPQEYKSSTVPDVLLSGDHQKIEEWRIKQAVQITTEKRPDLLKG